MTTKIDIGFEESGEYRISVQDIFMRYENADEVFQIKMEDSDSNLTLDSYTLPKFERRLRETQVDADQRLEAWFVKTSAEHAKFVESQMIRAYAITLDFLEYEIQPWSFYVARFQYCMDGMACALRARRHICEMTVRPVPVVEDLRRYSPPMAVSYQVNPTKPVTTFVLSDRLDGVRTDHDTHLRILTRP